TTPRWCHSRLAGEGTSGAGRCPNRAHMNRRGFLFAAGAGLGLGAISAPPAMLVRMSGDVLPAAHTPDPSTWSNNRITLAWLGHATVLINFYGVRVLTDPALFPRIGVDAWITTFGPLRLTSCPLLQSPLPGIDLVFFMTTRFSGDVSIVACPTRP